MLNLPHLRLGRKIDADRQAFCLLLVHALNDYLSEFDESNIGEVPEGTDRRMIGNARCQENLLVIAADAVQRALDWHSLQADMWLRSPRETGMPIVRTMWRKLLVNCADIGWLDAPSGGQPYFALTASGKEIVMKMLSRRPIRKFMLSESFVTNSDAVWDKIMEVVEEQGRLPRFELSKIVHQSVIEMVTKALMGEKEPVEIKLENISDFPGELRVAGNQISSPRRLGRQPYVWLSRGLNPKIVGSSMRYKAASNSRR